MADANWKKRTGIEINYSPSQSSEDDDVDGEVVERRWKGLESISAEYDHLSSTPPRTRIRNKEKYKSYNAGEGHPPPAAPRVPRRNTTDNFLDFDPTLTSESADPKSKRRSLKLLRGHERDLKLDIGKCKSCRLDTLPARVATMANIPTLVESCNRFMSLSSKPVHSGREQSCPPVPQSSISHDDFSLYQSSSVLPPPRQSAADLMGREREDTMDDCRANFHTTFSMLIRMGNVERNVDKNCKRTMSVEEHTWQNELKDLVWLEVCAKKAGRTPTQQDAFLCSRRDEVPSLLQDIIDYKFVNTDNKCSGEAIWSTQASIKRSDSGVGNSSSSEGDITPAVTGKTECFCINCNNCSQAIGKAMLQVVALLDSLAEAEALYPSSKAMAAHHPLVLSEGFMNKTKAMCLWYNMVHHQRLLMLIIKKMLVNKWNKSFSKSKAEVVKANDGCRSSTASNESCEINHPSKVKFNIDTNSSFDNETISTINEKSAVEPSSEDEADSKHPSNVQIEITRIQSTEVMLTDLEHEESKDVIDSPRISSEHMNLLYVNGKSQDSDLDKSNEILPNSDVATKSPYESADSSAGSVNSNESGFVSSVPETAEDTNPYNLMFNVFEVGNLTELTKLRLYYPNQTSPYRDYIEKMLKIRGIRRALNFLEKLHLVVLKKTRMTLEKLEDVIKTDQSQSDDDLTDPNPTIEFNEEEDDDNSDEDFEFERHSRCEVNIKELKKEYIDLRRFGAWSKETIEMQLPSYRSLFLLLSTLPMENIHEFLSMKLETKPDKPSILSVKQLMSELRDGLTIAVRIRARFVRHSQTALMVEEDVSVCRKFFNTVLATFDNTLDEVYKLYLSYLSDWAGMEHLPRATLAAEWTFNSYLARSLRPAATLAPLTFCCLTVRQLDGAAERLKKRVTELGKEVKELGRDADNLTHTSPKGDTDIESHNSIKWKILSVCRDMQCLLTEERERTLSTAQFARTVSIHLHHNAIFRDYRQKIYKAMALVQNVLCWTINRMQETTSSERLMELEEADRPSVQSRTREIVSQAFKFGFEFHKEMCRLINDTLLPESSYNPCARNSLTQGRRPKLIRAESVNEANHTSIDENFYSFSAFTPTTTSQEFIYPAVPTNPKILSKGFSKDFDSFSKNLYRGGYKQFRNNHLRGTKFPSFESNASGISLAELKMSDFKNGIPGCEECNRVKSNAEDDNGMRAKTDKDVKAYDWEEMVSRSLVTFSKQWMNFAMERCERGRGLRPRWANHGLEFLMLTCDPQHTKHLTNQEFDELKAMMDSCISHVIGSSRMSSVSSNLSTPTGAISVPTPQRTRTSIHYPQQHPLTSRPLMASSPPTTFGDLSLLTAQPSPVETVRQGKTVSALRELDCTRDSALRRAGVIGSVRQGATHAEHFRPRPVTFKWQRGIKIGQGRFGKVYTVVNTESGQLLAMKEVSLGLGDRRAVERAANELQVLEGVVHPNLVRYYGVEIHREEMLIFMELCVEGSLDSLIAGTHGECGEGGLPEQLIRRYTGQLVCAVSALHVRAIAHRDIKSGNIFLTEGGNCLKLGDFGCAVKIRANTTVPGELQGYVGTQAYMAPEVFMKSSGHGRAADIWSLGCVVVEMATGKRPWSEYDSNYQIMFVVGMGGRPTPPAWLSPEGSNFCLDCLQHDPVQRATIDTLQHHHFVKINQHEDY